MKIVIDIPEEEYQIYINHTEAILDNSIPLVHQDLLKAVINGTPLPEHHGRLIDADMLKQSFKNHHDFFLDAYGGEFSQMTSKEQARIDEITNSIAEVVNAPTIIEGSERE